MSKDEENADAMDTNENSVSFSRIPTEFHNFPTKFGE